MGLQTIAIASSLLLLGSCGAKDEDTSKKDPTPVADQAKPETTVKPAQPKAPVMSWYPIPELGVQLELPGAARHSLVLTDVYGVEAAGCSLQIGKPYQGEAFYEETLTTFEKNYAGNTVESFSKKEKNEDGTFFVEAAYNTKRGLRWHIEDRIKVDGAKFPLLSCYEHTIQTAEHAACVSRACASAKKL